MVTRDELKSRASQIKNEVEEGRNTANRVGRLLEDFADSVAIKTELDILKKYGYLYAGIATPNTDPGTPDVHVFYIATTVGSYSNFGNIEVLKGESAILKWNNGTWVKSAIKPMTDFNSVFDANGKSLTEFESGIIYDVSALNGGVAFESLQALLNSPNLSTLIPTSVRHGGMTIRFIQGSEQSSDNKYVQARCMAESFTTDVTQWQGVDKEPAVRSRNFVESDGIFEKTYSTINGIDITSYNQGVPPIGGVNTNGSRSGSSNFYNYKFKPNGASVIIAHVGSNRNTELLAIAFYSEVNTNGGELDSSKFISGVSFNDTNIQEDYIAKIPSNCKMVVISNRSQMFNSYSVTFYQSIKDIVGEIGIRTSTLEDAINVEKDWKKTIWWTPNCTWDASNGRYSYNKPRITSVELFEVKSPCRVVCDLDVVNVRMFQYSSDGTYETQHTSLDLVVGKKYKFVCYNKELDAQGVVAPFLYPSDNPVWEQFKIIGNDVAEYKEVNMTDDIPSYYTSQLETAIETATEKLRNAGKNKACILFTTDCHWGANEKHSVPIVKLLKEKLNVSTVVNGGDIITDHFTDKADAYNELFDFQNRNKEIMPLFITIGNHDKNASAQTVPASVLTDNEAYYYINAQSENVVTKYGSYYAHYKDNIVEKTRYIFLSSGLMTVPDSDFNFLISSLNSLESGWNAVIIQHLWYNIVDNVEVLPPFITNLMVLMDDYNARSQGSFGNITYDFTSAMGKIQFGLGGHLHYDKNFTTTGGIPILLCDCDTYKDIIYKGTVNEHCVTVIIADYDSEKLYGVRIGRGSDIDISY